MTTPFGVAGELILSIGAGLAALALAAALAQRCLISASWRRAIWQACMLGMMLFAVLELAGARASWTQRYSRRGPTAQAPAPGAAAWPNQTASSTQKASDSEPRRGPQEVQRSLVESAPNPDQERARLTPPSLLVWKPADAEAAIAGPAEQGKSARWTRGIEVWTVRAWAAGCGLVLAWIGLSHGLFRRVRDGSVQVRDPKLCARVERARVALGLPATLRVLMSPRFQGPIAFGILRRGVGLPCGFGAETETRQDVMLLHELTHLAARDPAWQLCADLTAALIWWHPAVWWARRRLQFVSETAADEASLLVVDGPGALAECLVEQGLRLRQSSTARLAISGAGFRSGLARRVERLTRLREQARNQPRLWTVRLAKALGLAAGLGVLLLGASWAFPQLSTQGTTMKSSKVPVFALAALLAETAASAAEPVQPPPAAPAAPPVLAIPAAPAPPAIPTPVRPTAVARYGVAPPDPAVTPPTPPTPELALPAPPRGHPATGGMLFGGGTGGVGGGLLRHGSDQAQALRQKLEQIVLPDVGFDNLPLASVVEYLGKESTMRDPAKVGVNFLFGSRRLVTATDPATGLPAGKAPEQQSMEELTVRIVPPLKHVRLVDVLEAITRVTPEPIYYVVEDYAVVFTFDPPPRPPSEQQFAGSPWPPPASGIAQTVPRLKVRAFKFKKSAAVNSMEVTFGITMDRNADLTQVLRQKMFPKVGLHLDADRVMLFNELTSTLLVRASDEELASVAATLEMLAGPTSSEPGVTSR